MTTVANEKVINQLKKLIEICQEGKDGYRTAAEHIKNPEYTQLFEQYADQRREFEQALSQHLVTDQEGSSLKATVADAAGAVHRGWINLKSAVTGGSNSAILNECERGDAAALEAYEEALREPMPNEISTLVRQQHEKIRAAYQKVKSLEEMN